MELKQESDFDNDSLMQNEEFDSPLLDENGEYIERSEKK